MSNEKIASQYCRIVQQLIFVLEELRKTDKQSKRQSPTKPCGTVQLRQRKCVLAGSSNLFRLKKRCGLLVHREWMGQNTRCYVSNSPFEVFPAPHLSKFETMGGGFLSRIILMTLPGWVCPRCKKVNTFCPHSCNMLLLT